MIARARDAPRPGISPGATQAPAGAWHSAERSRRLTWSDRSRRALVAEARSAGRGDRDGEDVAPLCADRDTPDRGSAPIHREAGATARAARARPRRDRAPSTATGPLRAPTRWSESGCRRRSPGASATTPSAKQRRRLRDRREGLVRARKLGAKGAARVRHGEGRTPLRNPPPPRRRGPRPQSPELRRLSTAPGPRPPRRPVPDARSGNGSRRESASSGAWPGVRRRQSKRAVSRPCLLQRSSRLPVVERRPSWPTIERTRVEHGHRPHEDVGKCRASAPSRLVAEPLAERRPPTSRRTGRPRSGAGRARRRIARIL